MNCPLSLLNPYMAHIAPPLLHIPEGKQPTLPWFSIQDWHARLETCTFSPYPSACRATAYSFETQTWERAWGRWEGRRSMDRGGWSHKEKTRRRGARQGWGLFGVGSDEKQNKNRWWKTKMKGGWSRSVKNLSKGENKKVSAVHRSGQILVKETGLAGGEEEETRFLEPILSLRHIHRGRPAAAEFRSRGSTAEPHQKQSPSSVTARKAKEETKNILACSLGCS